MHSEKIDEIIYYEYRPMPIYCYWLWEF